MSSEQTMIFSRLKRHPTQRAPDGWDSARFLELVLNFGSFPFLSLFLSSRR
jgi:hypothetical protein